VETGKLICQAQESWAAKARAWNSKVLASAITHVKKRSGMARDTPRPC
jgi:hypothetical protein